MTAWPPHLDHLLSLISGLLLLLSLPAMQRIRTGQHPAPQHLLRPDRPAENSFRWASGSTSSLLAPRVSHRLRAKNSRLTCHWRCAVLSLLREASGSTWASYPELS